LKRRVASLPPITAEVFSEKVLQARAATSAEADKAYFERACEACQKTYYSENAYQNHLSSQKHKLKLATAARRPDDETTSVTSSTFSLGEPIPVRRASVDSDAEQEFNEVVEGLQRTELSEQRPSPVKRPSKPHALSETMTEDSADTPNERESNSATPVQSQAGPTWTVNSCIFCNFTSPSLDSNVQHMERFHGMFIPERPYLVNLEGLIRQLQEKVHEDHLCLFCGNVKSTVFGVQTHMRDKGHCKIPFTTEEEQLDIGEHYDFRSTYSDDEDESDSESVEDGNRTGGAKLGARRGAKITGADGEDITDEDADGWETDSSASSLDSDDLTAVPAEGHLHQYERLGKHPHHAHNDPRHRRQIDGYHSRAHKHTHSAFYDEYELHLPTGKSVGHRSLNKYYRQNLNNYPTPEERAERQAIEDSKDGEATNGDDQLTVSNGRNRAVVPRGAAGMMGVSDQKRQLARKSEQRGRALEQVHTKKRDYEYGKKLNNHKSYYYRYEGGG
jgi:pre-60S factor REI1